MRLLRLAPFVMTAALLGCFRPKAEMRLSLAKPQWEEGEFLWYRVELKNIGWKTMEVDDPSWVVQRRLLDNDRNRAGLYLVVKDSTGHVYHPSAMAWGTHGELSYWANDCGQGAACDAKGFRPIPLKRGATLATTPSIESPVRPQGGTFEITDQRACLHPGMTKEACESWQRQAEGIGLFGDPRRVVDAVKARREIPPGYRVLDAVQLPGPGHYSVQAIYDGSCALPPLSAEEEMSKPGWCEGQPAEVCARLAGAIRAEWARKSPGDIDFLRQARSDCARRNAGRVSVESNIVEFDVVANSHPGPAAGVRGPQQVPQTIVAFRAARKAAEGTLGRK